LGEGEKLCVPLGKAIERDRPQCERIVGHADLSRIFASKISTSPLPVIQEFRGILAKTRADSRLNQNRNEVRTFAVLKKLWSTGCGTDHFTGTLRFSSSNQFSTTLICVGAEVRD
jgi:hypothetical protein